MATKSRALSFMTLLAALQVLSLASARLGVSEDGHMRALYEDDAAVRFLPLQVIGHRSSASFIAHKSRSI